VPAASASLTLLDALAEAGAAALAAVAGDADFARGAADVGAAPNGCPRAADADGTVTAVNVAACLTSGILVPRRPDAGPVKAQPSGTAGTRSVCADGERSCVALRVALDFAGGALRERCRGSRSGSRCGGLRGRQRCQRQQKADR